MIKGYTDWEISALTDKWMSRTVTIDSIAQKDIDELINLERTFYIEKLKEIINEA